MSFHLSILAMLHIYVHATVIQGTYGILRKFFSDLLTPNKCFLLSHTLLLLPTSLAVCYCPFKVKTVTGHDFCLS